MSHTELETYSRGRGRPRLAVDERILDATIEELCIGGVADCTVEGVAARAGVARNTVYRRWPTKVDLVVGAIELLRSRTPIPDTGDVRADLEAGIANMIHTFCSPQGRAIAAVLYAQLHNDELAQACREKISGPHLTATRAILERAIKSGEIRLLMGIDETIALLSGIAYVALLGANTMDVTLDLARGVVATVFEGIAERPPTRR